MLIPSIPAGIVTLGHSSGFSLGATKHSLDDGDFFCFYNERICVPLFPSLFAKLPVGLVPDFKSLSMLVFSKYESWNKTRFF